VSLLRAAQTEAVLGQIAGRAASSLVAFAGLIRELAAKAERLPAADLVEELIRRIGYAEHIAAQVKEPALRQRRIENLQELSEWFRAMQKNGAAGDLAAQLALLSHGERDDPGNAARLMTLHSAKGLEFRFVFLVGLDDHTLPHEGSIAEGRVEEERRLLYVGITRAKQQLTLSYAKRKRRFGEVLANQPSRFLKELPGDDLHWSGQDPELDAAHKKELASAHIARLASLLAD
ncbi:MAG: 3'-5' exonuclease, partial [Lysobacterales bacterium]